MHIKTKDFQFKQFSISGGHGGMPVSTDGVMLGAWATLPESGHLLDIGTGTGLLSLMCAQRSAISLNITAIELEANASHTALGNFNQSPWHHRLTFIHGDVLNHAFSHPFDAIICNPPYFNSGQQAGNRSRADARHTNTLTHESLLNVCHALLTDQGNASFILPSVEGQKCIDLALKSGWYLHSRCDIQTTERKAPSRVMFSLVKQPCETGISSLVIHQNGQYSSDFVTLTQDFYLKM
ncbi:methyltransferase [Vibrio sp. S9_S30]|uniref:tRNA1(Val) (adenine(37)-N6)-methyltransferase n=1 Tax=Vibrio sp. S9_S30 TaxID=2720226 RepID=UPI001680DF48|nr:methyltransferase [Vibrio sp. S9_S30]MBD1558889.1 methyltransferase [Vibrio sp. S9_S30]